MRLGSEHLHVVFVPFEVYVFRVPLWTKDTNGTWMAQTLPISSNAPPQTTAPVLVLMTQAQTRRNSKGRLIRPAFLGPHGTCIMLKQGVNGQWPGTDQPHFLPPFSIFTPVRMSHVPFISRIPTTMPKSFLL